MTFDPYKTLGVNKADSKEKIKKAYRKKAKKLHPDAGGSAEEFDTINAAYRLLVCDSKRARLEAGEDPEDILNKTAKRDSEIHKLLGEIFVSMIQGGEVDLDHDDLFAKMRGILQKAIRGAKELEEEEKRKIAKFKKVQKKMSSKKKNNFFYDLAQSIIEQLERNIINTQKTRKDFEEAWEFLQDFSYQFDSRPQEPQFFQVFLHAANF